MKISLQADADALRALHDVIVLEPEEGAALGFETLGAEPTRPVAAALAAAGFSGASSGSGIQVNSFDPSERALVKLRSFSVTGGSAGEVEMWVRMALAGDLGGFLPVVGAMVGFHRIAWAFQYVWARAGMPAIVLHRPTHPRGAAEGGRPGSILLAAAGEPRLRATLERARELPEEAV